MPGGFIRFLSLPLAAVSRPAAMVFGYSDGLKLVAPIATERNKAVREIGINNAVQNAWKIRLNLGEEPFHWPDAVPALVLGRDTNGGRATIRPVSERYFLGTQCRSYNFHDATILPSGALNPNQTARLQSRIITD